MSNSNLVKLEVLSDPKSLLPVMDETLVAAKELVKDGFEVMVYCTDNLDYAMKLEDLDKKVKSCSPYWSGLYSQPNAISKIVQNFYPLW